MNRFGTFDTRKFSDIYISYVDFEYDYKNMPKSFQVLSSDDLETTYYLLYANYGNSTVASYDENRFKYKLFSIIMSYGAYWAKRKEIQEKLRGLSEEEIVSGSRVISNHAQNPSSDPSTSGLDELTYIDSQNTQGYKKSKIEAYMQYLEGLDVEYNDEYMNKFKRLFISIVEPYNELLYESEE